MHVDSMHAVAIAAIAAIAPINCHDTLNISKLTLTFQFRAFSSPPGPRKKKQESTLLYPVDWNYVPLVHTPVACGT